MVNWSAKFFARHALCNAFRKITLKQRISACKRVCSGYYKRNTVIEQMHRSINRLHYFWSSPVSSFPTSSYVVWRARWIFCKRIRTEEKTLREVQISNVKFVITSSVLKEIGRHDEYESPRAIILPSCTEHLWQLFLLNPAMVHNWII